MHTEYFMVRWTHNGTEYVTSTLPNGSWLDATNAARVAAKATAEGCAAVSVEPLPKPILELHDNGDPYGRGFTASESIDGGHSWFYCGNISPASRETWRTYARRNGYTLRESR